MYTTLHIPTTLHTNLLHFGKNCTQLFNVYNKNYTNTVHNFNKQTTETLYKTYLYTNLQTTLQKLFKTVQHCRQLYASVHKCTQVYKLYATAHNCTNLTYNKHKIQTIQHSTQLFNNKKALTIYHSCTNKPCITR